MVFLAAAFSLASSDVASDPISPVLPNGSYRYGMYDDGTRAGVSTITVSRHDGVIRIDDKTELKDDQMSTTRSIDPATFTTLDYAVTEGAHDRVEIAADGATIHDGTKTQTLARPAEGPSIVFDYFVGEYIALPAMLHAGTTHSFNIYCLCVFGNNAKAAAVVAATAARPAGVPATDAAAAFVLDDATATMWYDPVSFVLRELDLPTVRIRIALLS